MKNILTFIVVVVVLGVGWYLLSPLFIDQTVDEALPVAVTPIDISIEDEADGQVDIPDDIIIGQDVIMDEPMILSPKPTIETRGEFTGTDNFHKAEGKLLVISDIESQYLRFEDFSVTNGPDLFVTLNKGIPTSSNDFSEHIILEPLKGNKGSQNYSLGDIDITKYDSVSIYCRAFGVLFAVAEL